MIPFGPQPSPGCWLSAQERSDYKCWWKEGDVQSISQLLFPNFFLLLEAEERRKGVGKRPDRMGLWRRVDLRE